MKTNFWIVVIACALLAVAASAQAQVTTYCCDETAEAAYLADIAALGTTVSESFEGTAWDGARSPYSQAAVTSQDITWSRDGGGVTTNNFASWDGAYQMFAVGADGLSHPVPDGFSIAGNGLSFNAAGGWFQGQDTKIRFIVDGDPNRVDFTGAESTVLDWKFLGFIDLTAFSNLFIGNVDETGNETKLFWADAFHFATQPAAAVRNDLDGDGRSDFLWRNTATGQNALWRMDGATRLSNEAVPTVSNFDWQIAGTGDLDGDRQTDIVWRNAVTGQLVFWGMAGATRIANENIGVVGSASWGIAAIEDFDGDGRSDLLWRNSATGQNALWRMNGATRLSNEAVPTVSNFDWQIAGAGDLDGDRQTDLVWRNAVTGQLVFWGMAGATRIANENIGVVGSASWGIAAIEDFDGDGRSDLLWRNSATGQNALWRMNGATRLSNEAVPTVSNFDWQITATGDLDGDLKTDIVWRNAITGQLVYWRMSGATRIANQFISTVSNPTWLIIE